LSQQITTLRGLFERCAVFPGVPGLTGFSPSG
jgi:hypothetical protein